MVVLRRWFEPAPYDDTKLCNAKQGEVVMHGFGNEYFLTKTDKSICIFIRNVVGVLRHNVIRHEVNIKTNQQINPAYVGPYMRRMINKGQGYYWVRQKGMILTKKPNGQYVVYHKTNKMLQRKATPEIMYLGGSPIVEELFKEEFGFHLDPSVLFGLAYPNSCIRYEELHTPRAAHYSKLLQVFLKHMSAKEACKEITGYKGSVLTTKLLQGACRNVDLQFNVIKALRKLGITEDHMAGIIDLAIPSNAVIKNPYRFFKTAGLAKIVRWMTHGSVILFRDVNSTWNRLIDDPATKDLANTILREESHLEEAHDRLTNLWRRMNGLKQRRKVRGGFSKRTKAMHALIDNQTRENVTITVPSAETVVEWGEVFHHCIGTYAENFKEGRTILFGVWVDGVLTYQGQCNPNTYTLVQLHGNRNCYAPEDVREKVLSILRSAYEAHNKNKEMPDDPVAEDFD